MSKFYSFLCACTFLLLPFSMLQCHSDVDIDVKSLEPNIVISAFCSPDDVFSVYLSESMMFDDPLSKKPVKDAKIALFSKGALLENLSFDEKSSSYKGSEIPLAGESYSLMVSHDALPDVSAVTVVPKMPVVSLAFNLAKFKADLSFTIKDDPDVENFYRLLVVEYWGGPIVKFPFIESVDPVLRNKGEDDGGASVDSDPKNMYSIFSDKMFNGKEYKMDISFNHVNYDGENMKVKLVVQAISKDYFLFLKSHAAQRASDYIPFSEPVKLYSNVMGGLGIFTAFSQVNLFLN